MCKKTVKDRYLVLSILFAFCFSSPSLGGQLLYGEGVEYGHHNVHMHDPRIGEEIPDDEHFTVYYDSLTIAPSSTLKACSVINSYLHSNCHLENYRNLCPVFSVHHSCINRFFSTRLYQLTSSYLI